MKTMSIFVALVAVLALSEVALAQIQVERIESEPAWCGGSYNATGGLDAKSFHGLDALALAPSGTNFGDCVPITRSVKGVQGETTISVPTHPAAPAGQVLFDKGIPTLVTTDADGKEIRVELVPSKP
jgi:hypothetical protein